MMEREHFLKTGISETGFPVADLGRERETDRSNQKVLSNAKKWKLLFFTDLLKYGRGLTRRKVSKTNK